MFRNVLLPITRTKIQVSSIRFVQKKFPKKDKKIQAAAESLAARGFLRPNKPWDPPKNIEETILKICISNGLKEDSEFDSLDIKFKILKACFNETGHGVPNSLLHSIETVEHLLEFYETPVNVLTPFDTLKKMELPKNMYVQEDYVRFHPEFYYPGHYMFLILNGYSRPLYVTPIFRTNYMDHGHGYTNHIIPNICIIYKDHKDTLFNGVSAYPRSSTIVTGLKSRKKYEGYTAKRSWP